jgi:polyisoprenoid-binding protein YceI
MTSTQTMRTPADCPRPGAAKWQVDSAHSSAGFQAASLWGLVPVRGRVGEVDGSLEWDGSEGRGRMTIAATGLSSGIRLRDHHLRGSDFFDVANHPEVVFEATEVIADGAAVQLRGELHVRGRRHPFATTANVRRLGRDRIELQASAPLDLGELGMSRGLLRMVSAEVSADVRVVLRRVAT